jgi:hypothetical protein
MTGELVAPSLNAEYTQATQGGFINAFGVTGLNVAAENLLAINEYTTGNNQHINIRSVDFTGVQHMQFGRNDFTSPAGFDFYNSDTNVVTIKDGQISVPVDPSADEHLINKGYADNGYYSLDTGSGLGYCGGYYICGDSLTAPNGLGTENDPKSWAYVMTNDGRMATQINAANARGIYHNGYAPGGGTGTTWDLSGYVANPSRTDAIIHLGSNDDNGNATKAQFQTAYQKLIDDLEALGLRVHCVLPPHNDVWNTDNTRSWVEELRPDAYDWPLGRPTIDGVHMTQTGHNRHATTAHNALLNSTPTYPLRGPDGTPANPTYSFTNQTGTGMLWDGSNNTLEFAINGSVPLEVSGLGVTAALVESTSNFIAADGAANAPGYLFKSRTNTGLYLTPGATAADAQLHVTINGNDVGNFNQFGMTTPLAIDALAFSESGTNISLTYETIANVAAHTGDATIHFTEGSIDHTAIQNRGTNTHAQIDAHIGTGNIHFTDAAADGTKYVRQNNAWVAESAGGVNWPLLADDGTAGAPS